MEIVDFKLLLRRTHGMLCAVCGKAKDGKRALECRRMAESFRDESSRDRMLNAAADFEGIAGELRKLEIAQGVLPWEDFCAN